MELLTFTKKFEPSMNIHYWDEFSLASPQNKNLLSNFFDGCSNCNVVETEIHQFEEDTWINYITIQFITILIFYLEKFYFEYVQGFIEIKLFYIKSSKNVK